MWAVIVFDTVELGIKQGKIRLFEAVVGLLGYAKQEEEPEIRSFGSFVPRGSAGRFRAVVLGEPELEPGIEAGSAEELAASEIPIAELEFIVSTANCR